MTDKIEQKKRGNLTSIDFNKKKSSFPDDFISRIEVHSILSANLGRFIDQWFKFIIEWNRNAYSVFQDLDKYFILIHLIQKSFRHFADIFVIYSEEEFYSKAEFEIEKINLIEISQELNIPKETIRRKINEMHRDNIIARKGKKIIITPKAFTYQRPRQSIKKMSSFLSICSKYLSTQDWFGPSINAEAIEEFTRKNFTLVWRFFFRLWIPFLVRQRSFYGDLETFFVSGIIYANQSAKVRESYLHNPITLTSTNTDMDLGLDSYKKWMRTVVDYPNKIIGVNASSISEITGVPRATVIRKLNIVERKELIFKDKNQLYTLGKKYKKHLKELEQIFVTNQIELAKFVATFFELYKNENLNNKFNK